MRDDGLGFTFVKKHGVWRYLMSATWLLNNLRECALEAK
jgi:hypothetical protein